MMKNEELLTVLKIQLSDTIKYANDEFRKTNKQLNDSYNQELYGYEEDGHSQVVSSDHYDTVESDMPSFARVFLGANKVMEFLPFGTNDTEEARQKTEYARHIIHGQKDSFKILHDWLKEPGFAKCSVIKFYSEEVEKPEYHFYDDIDLDELTGMQTDLEGMPGIDRVEIESQNEITTGKGGNSEPVTRYDIRFRAVRKTKKITLANVPVESFIITRGSASKNDAMLVGDECKKTKGELIAEGFDEKMVRDLKPAGKAAAETSERFKGQGGWDYKSGYHWTNDEVLIQNLYPLVDYDEDGIPERRYIMKCGEKILKNEPYGIVPYALNSQILMPHSAIGKSRGEQAAKYQEEKTALNRALRDNIYSVSRPRHAIDDGGTGDMDGGKVDLDDLMTHQVNGVVRCDGNPMELIMPMTTPYIGGETLQVIQYIDTEKSNSLGQMLTNQGLSSDQFYKETATRFEGVEESAQAKIELAARVYAETGWRELYEGVIWTAQHYQDSEAEIMVLGRPLKVDPRGWKYEHYCMSKVGLGAGDSASALENLGTLLQTQLNLLDKGSPLVDSEKLYNTLEDISRALGKPDTSRYYNNPEMPQEQLLAIFEKTVKENQILKQQVGKNPLAEAEQIKLQGKLAEIQERGDLKRQEIAFKSDQEMRQFYLKMAQDNEQFRKEMLFNLTKLDLEHTEDVPGSLV